MANMAFRGAVRVGFVELGEGLLGGEYDDTRPGDVEVLRFDVAVRQPNGTYETIDNGSYCTALPVATPTAVQLKVLAFIADVVEPARRQGNGGVKRLLERLSWIGAQEAVEICSADSACVREALEV